MDEISKINIFNHHAVNKANDELLKKQNSKPEDKKEVKEQDAEKSAKVPSEQVLDAMNLKGLMNKVQMGVNSVNPRDYLSEERIKDIEESMGIFEAGVEKHAEAIRKEFGALMLSEASIYELAANSFSMNV